MKFFNGDEYEGEFSNNTITGYGKYIWKDGNFFEGNFTNGIING